MKSAGGNRPQRTIHKPFEFEGIGLHMGKNCRVRVSPSGPSAGIRFIRTDLKSEIPLSPEGVTSTLRGTNLTGKNGAVIHTVEHFLAAVSGMGLDNLTVEMDSEEMPILDGSSAPYCGFFRAAGILEQAASVSPLIVTETFEVRHGDVSIKVEPAEGLYLDVEISFPYPGLESQKRSFHLADGNFERELASARTFCFEEEVEHLRGQGLIKGGNLDCAVVIGKKGLLNGPYRFEDEIVRHKTLDLLGDLMLLNRPLWARITAKKAGHRFHVELARAILKKAGLPIKSEVPMMDSIEIQRVLPHRFPMLLVDRILEMVPNQRVVGIKNVSANEPFFQGHFPGNPIMPGVLVIEAMAQCGGVAFLSGPNDEGKNLYLAGVDNARFRRPIVPGDQIRFEIDVLSLRSRIAKVSGKAYVEGQVAVEAEITCAIVDRNVGKKDN